MKRSNFNRTENDFSFFDGARHPSKASALFRLAKASCIQINMEYLSEVFRVDENSGLTYPDSVYGTDSHTPMVNGLGVLGWGVGGIEAEMAMLGRDTAFPVPEVVGIRLSGTAQAGITATDVVLTVTERLREVGVVSKFVEFCGATLSQLPVADRATIANMAPEYGATCVFFPIDDQTLRYLALSGRSETEVEAIHRCAKAQGLWRDDDAELPTFRYAGRYRPLGYRPKHSWPETTTRPRAPQ